MIVSFRKLSQILENARNNRMPNHIQPFIRTQNRITTPSFFAHSVEIIKRLCYNTPLYSKALMVAA